MTAGVLYTPNNVIVGQAAGYFAPADEPAPADTVAAFGDWAGQWVNPGGTEDGWKLTGNQSTTDHRIEEQASVVRQTLESRTFGIGASLAEDTLENIKYAFGGGTIVVTPGTAGAPTVKVFTLSDEVDEFAVGLDMQTAGGSFGLATRRIIIPRAVSAASVDTAFRRSAAKRLWPVAFVAVCKTSEIIVKDIVPTA